MNIQTEVPAPELTKGFTLYGTEREQREAAAPAIVALVKSLAGDLGARGNHPMADHDAIQARRLLLAALDQLGGDDLDKAAIRLLRVNGDYTGAFIDDWLEDAGEAMEAMQQRLSAFEDEHFGRAV